MAKKVGPYVGVTGFMSSTEVNKAITMIPRKSKRRLMVGVLMSSKTLAGQENKWPCRYPKKEVIADIFINNPRTLNLIHYSTDQPETLSAQLMEITESAGPHLDGFQLNIAWPLISQVRAYRKANPEKFLLLQIGERAMAQAGSMELFSKLVDLYLPMIDAILIDQSGGKGEPLNALKVTEYLRAVCDYPTLGLGVAGGLGPDTLHLLDKLVPEFPNLSIDAEGRLRTLRPDALSIEAMRIYLDDAFPILTGKEMPGLKFRKVCVPYGYEEHLQHYGSGDNMLRTPRLSQPGALQVGDVLATGDRVLSLPREGGNGSVLIHLTGGFDGHWIGVPSRIPIALLTKEDNALEAL